MKFNTNFKFKKVFIFTILGAMGVVMLVAPGLTGDLSNKTLDSDGVYLEEDSTEAMQRSLSYEDARDVKEDSEATATLSPTLSPTPSPTQKPKPVYDLVENNDPEIDALIRDYYAARINHDIDMLKSLSSDPSNVISLSRLAEITEYDEDYRNIKVYTKDGVDKGTYIAYVYYDTKITGIITLAPNLSKFFIISDEEGQLKIFDGEMEADFKEYYDERNNDPDVGQLIDEIYVKMEEAMNSDQDLAEFWSSLISAE